MWLWHRLHVWLAMRTYACIPELERLATALMANADARMRRHAEDPQQRLDLGDD